MLDVQPEEEDGSWFSLEMKSVHWERTNLF